jgi:hypothetical protein
MDKYNIFGKIDTMKENLILGAELVGKYDFPKLKPVNYIPGDVVPFSRATMEKNCQKKWIHFFVDDDKFERVFAQPDRYLKILELFAGVITPDFSSYLDMPMAMQIYNRYRNRALAYYYQSQGLRIIPTVGWSDEASYDWCFAGLPECSTLAVSTNGCFHEEGKKYYIAGMIEMERRLKPTKIICVGRPIPVPINTEIMYFDSFGQQMTKRLREKRVGIENPKGA